MAQKESCSWPQGCDRNLDRSGGRGLCNRHYHRAFVDGTLHQFERVTKTYATTEDRFFAKVDARGVCWEWQAALNNRGYGVFGVRVGRNVYAHRWSWEYLVGPIGDGLTIDHLCRNTRCVNPDHLEPVSLSENVRRANPKRQICIRGHDLSLAYVRSDGSRMCRLCRADRRAANQAAMQEKEVK